MTTNAFRLVFVLTFVLVLAGCLSNERIFRSSQLRNPDRRGPVYVFTRDSALYKLDKCELRDSLLLGSGTREKDGARQRFEGELPLKNVRTIETMSFDFGKTVLALGVTVAFGVVAAGYLGGTDGLASSEQVTYHGPSGGGGGSSCPSIYSWNGSEYQLDGESFGTALGKMLEMKSVTVLPSLRESGGAWNVRIMNERPETHFINQVEMNAVEVDESAAVVADGEGTLWQIAAPVEPVRARANGSTDISPLVRQKDRLYWETDTLHLADATDFEDQVEAEFSVPAGAASGSLVISAINTDFSTPVYRSICRFLGDDAGAFTWSIEHDSDLVRSIRSWIDESSLKISLWNGTDWKQIGSLLPEATAASFSRVVRFSVNQVSGGVVKLRLSCLKDVWKFDAIQVDWSPSYPLRPMPVKLLSALGSDGSDCTGLITRPDAGYLVLLPPEKAELRYRAIAPSPGKKIVCALGVQGYLHEWIDRSGTASLPSWCALIPSSQRLDVLKELLQHPAVFLPPIYAEWAKSGRKPL